MQLLFFFYKRQLCALAFALHIPMGVGCILLTQSRCVRVDARKNFALLSVAFICQLLMSRVCRIHNFSLSIALSTVHYKGSSSFDIRSIFCVLCSCFVKNLVRFAQKIKCNSLTAWLRFVELICPRILLLTGAQYIFLNKSVSYSSSSVITFIAQNIGTASQSS